MNEHIWESFDSLWQTVHQLSYRLSRIEARLAELEPAVRASNQGEGKPGDSLNATEFHETRKIA